MATAWTDINSVFFDLIEEDPGFFNYYNATDEESYILAEQRANSMLRDAANRVAMECDSGTTFTDYYKDEETGEMYFTADLNASEIYLLANLQYEAYLRRDVAKLRAFQHQYTPSDLQVFSPANDRKTFMEMYKQIQEENKDRLDRYKSRDRLTGEVRGIDYSSYDTEEESS